MKLYIDDNLAARALAAILRKYGHDVELPSDAGLVGETDPVHLTYAIRQGRVALTSNHDDFEELHDLILQARGHHPGIVAIRHDNDPRRDLTNRGICLALRNFEGSGVAIPDTFVVLNHWR